jgi:hypothetical protein
MRATRQRARRLVPLEAAAAVFVSLRISLPDL